MDRDRLKLKLTGFLQGAESTVVTIWAQLTWR